MTKRLMAIWRALVLAGLVLTPFGHAESMSNEEILQELKSLKDRIERLEQEIKAKDEELKALKEETVKREEVPYVVQEMAEEDAALAAQALPWQAVATDKMWQWNE